MNKKVFTLSGLAVLCLVVALVLTQSEPAPKNMSEQMLRLSQSLDGRLLPSQPWQVADYSQFLLPDGQTLRQDVASTVQANFAELKRRLKLYSNIPEAQGLQQILETSVVGTVLSVDYPHYRLNLINTYAPMATVLDMQSHMKVVYFGFNQWQKTLSAKNAAVAEFNPEIDALLVPCMEFSHPGVRDALIFHELKHGQQWQQMKAFGLAPNRFVDGKIPDAMADQEVVAHHLSSQILNVSSNGEYYKRLQEVSAKYSAISAADLVMKVRSKDIVYIDELFGKAGAVEAGMRRYGYFFSLGNLWIEKHVPAEQRTKLAREFFLELFSAQPS